MYEYARSWQEFLHWVTVEFLFIAKFIWLIDEKDLK